MCRKGSASPLALSTLPSRDSFFGRTLSPSAFLVALFKLLSLPLVPLFLCSPIAFVFSSLALLIISLCLCLSPYSPPFPLSPPVTPLSASASIFSFKDRGRVGSRINFRAYTYAETNFLHPGRELQIRDMASRPIRHAMADIRLWRITAPSSAAFLQPRDRSA